MMMIHPAASQRSREHVRVTGVNMRFGYQEAGRSFCDLASLLFPNAQHAIISNVTIPINWYIPLSLQYAGGAPFQCQLWAAAALGDLEGLVS